MPYPINKWDQVPVYGVYMTAPGDTPVAGTVRFTLSQRVTRTDNRVIHPEGARVQVTIGAADQQDATVRAAVRTAWRAVDEAAQGAGFDGAAWDIWWDTIVLPAAIFTSFPASDDPDIVQHGWTVAVEEAIPGGKKYAIQPLMSQLGTPIPGINLGSVEVPPGAPSVPAPVYAKGVAGGVAALDADGDVVDALGEKVTGGGLPEDATIADLAESSTVKYFTSTEKSKLAGVATGATANDTDANLRARSNHTGSQAISTVTGLQTALDGKATAAQGAKADTAVQPAALTAKADDSAVVKLTGAQTVAGVKTFSAAPVVPDAAFAIAKINGLQAQLDSLSNRTRIEVVATQAELPNPMPAGIVYAVIAGS